MRFLSGVRKGQAAMEFLMTYGWAILVVLVVIAALAYFGVLNPGRLLPERCDIPNAFQCADLRISATAGSNQIGVINMEGNDVIITGAHLGANAGSTGYKCDVTGLTQQIRAGEGGKITVSTCTVPTAIGGEKLKGYIAIDYTSPMTGVTNSVNGSFLKSLTT